MTSLAEPRTARPEAVRTGSPRRRRLGRPRLFPFAGLIGIAVVLGAWSIASAAGALDPRKLSAPWTVVQTGIDLIGDGTLQANLGPSLYRVAIGFAAGVLIGTALAVFAGLTRVGEALVDGPIQVKRAIPLLGLAPLMILWLGIGEQFKIVLIALGVITYMYVQTHAALTSIDHRYVELAEVLGLSRAAFVRRVVIPGALPGFFLGLRLSATIAWLTLVVVEEVNATDGLGKMIFKAQDYGQSDVILVGLAVFGILGFASDAILRVLERKVLSWRRTLAS